MAVILPVIAYCLNRQAVGMNKIKGNVGDSRELHKELL